MSDNKRTKGNWIVSHPKISEVVKGQTYFSIQTRSGEIRELPDGKKAYAFVGFYYPDGIQSPEEMKANAEFICKAVNAHDELIKQLTELREFSEVALSHIKMCSSVGNKNPELEEGLQSKIASSKNLLEKLKSKE